VEQIEHLDHRRTVRSRTILDRRPSAALWKPRLHFLDVGETGGDVVRAALGGGHADEADHVVVLHGHRATMLDLPVGDALFLCLRDPVSRFVAAFQRRLQEGRTHPELAHTAEEAQAFARYPTPMALGEALAQDPTPTEVGEAVSDDPAAGAMHAIRFVRDRSIDWVGGWERFEVAADEGRIYAVLRSEELEATLPTLLGSLGLPVPEGIVVPDHLRSAPVDELLSPTAVMNLRRWFAPEEALLERCRRLGLVWTAS
jgi:hypothetical protein